MWVQYFKLIWFKLTCSRSACTLIGIKDRRQPLCWSSWLRSSAWQLIPTDNKIHNTTRIYDGSHANTNMPLSRGRLLHYVGTSRTLIRKDKLRADQTFHSWFILLCNDMFMIVANLQSPSVTVIFSPNMCSIIKNKEYCFKKSEIFGR